MRILMISPMCPYPANTGGYVRIARLFEGLARHHDVVLAMPQPRGMAAATPRPGAGSIVEFPDGASRPLKTLKAVLGPWPYHASLYFSESMRRGIREMLRSTPYALIYCHFIYTLPYVQGAGAPVVVDQQNVDRQYWVRKAEYYRRHGDRAKYWFSRVNLSKTIRFENAALRYVRGVVSVAEEDAAATREFAPANVTRFLVAPNGVDTRRFVPAAPTPGRPPGELVIGFLGSLDLELNQRAAFVLCNEILPRVQARLPDVAVSALIVGRNPPAELVEYGRNHPAARITVTGTVEDVLPYLHRMDVLALPLESGAGTKLRVLEAMAAGVCVVGSHLALMGIEGLLPGEHAFLAQNSEESTATICDLARDPERRRRAERRARQLVEERYSWDLITSHLSAQLEAWGSAGESAGPGR